jgi:predicted CXXCH cytochrome family protein
MRNFLWFSLLLTGLVLFGCDSSEEPVTQQEPAKKEVVTTKEAQPVASTVTTVQPVADQAEEKKELTQKASEELAMDPSKKTTEATGEAKTNAEKAVKAEKSESSAAAEEVTKETTEKVAAVKETSIPKTITLEASYGNITFPHVMQADSYACSTCHNEGTPAAFELTKVVAHKVCKGCHKDEGSGPTGCKGCHVK